MRRSQAELVLTMLELIGLTRRALLGADAGFLDKNLATELLDFTCLFPGLDSHYSFPTN